MFAVIESGGKQYKVSSGQIIQIEKIPHKKEGDIVIFDKVLFLNNGKETLIGTPYLDATSVLGKVANEVKGRKLIAFKYRPKERYRRKVGHRQKYFNVLIEEIKSEDQKIKAESVSVKKNKTKSNLKEKTHSSIKK